MLLKIDEARYLGGHRVQIRFNDGRTAALDMRTLAVGGPGTVFARLADEEFARCFKLEHGTLCWPGELDVAPEYLYFLAFREDPGLYEQFVDWGYLPQTTRA